MSTARKLTSAFIQRNGAQSATTASMTKMPQLSAGASDSRAGGNIQELLITDSIRLIKEKP